MDRDPDAPEAASRSFTPEGAARRRLPDGATDDLMREEALLMLCHGARLLTMRTPGADADLARGFLLAEGVVSNAADIAAIRMLPGDPAATGDGGVDRVEITLRDPSDARIEGRLTRTHEVRASCGLCGADRLDALLDELPPLLPGVPHTTTARLANHVAALRARQPLFDATGGCHAAALFGPDDETPWSHAEDVGRHNALDKAIGRAARDGRPLERATAVLSGRAGADLVLKCLRVGIPVIASVSAPSAFAFDLCEAAGATLVGFVRGDRAKVYCGTERLNDRSASPESPS